MTDCGEAILPGATATPPVISPRSPSPGSRAAPAAGSCPGPLSRSPGGAGSSRAGAAGAASPSAALPRAAGRAPGRRGPRRGRRRRRGTAGWRASAGWSPSPAPPAGRGGRGTSRRRRWARGRAHDRAVAAGVPRRVAGSAGVPGLAEALHGGDGRGADVEHPPVDRTSAGPPPGEIALGLVARVPADLRDAVGEGQGHAGVVGPPPGSRPCGPPPR
jgi:hypothetical protein